MDRSNSDENSGITAQSCFDIGLLFPVDRTFTAIHTWQMSNFANLITFIGHAVIFVVNSALVANHNSSAAKRP